MKRYRSHSNSSAGSCAEYEERVNHQHCDDAKVIKPILKKPVEVINYRAPTPPPIVQRFVEREPTPEPELIERVIKLLFLGGFLKIYQFFK